ncbi:acyl carrier protein 1, mitochondrial-like, partial [Prunus avium]|uniref:Acyl carrier protein 1, mitochondrial-like n=1 Tax=Prunus avium TaxID=42229 RepID=A0A6P5RGN1_PRUAV
MALRAALLRHVRIPVQTLNPALTLTGGKWGPPSLRWMSSHDDHLTKSEVTERVLSVVKSFPKVDPSTVCLFLPLPSVSFPGNVKHYIRISILVLIFPSFLPFCSL